MGELDPLLSPVGGKYNQAEETIQPNSFKIENLTEHSADLGGEYDFVSQTVIQKHNVTVGKETVDAEEINNQNESGEKDTFLFPKRQFQMKAQLLSPVTEDIYSLAATSTSFSMVRSKAEC